MNGNIKIWLGLQYEAWSKSYRFEAYVVILIEHMAKGKRVPSFLSGGFIEERVADVLADILYRRDHPDDDAKDVIVNHTLANPMSSYGTLLSPEDEETQYMERAQQILRRRQAAASAQSSCESN